MVGYRNDQTLSALNLPIGTLPPFNGSLRGNDVKCVTIERQRHITASELASAFGGIADMAGLAAGSTRSRMTPRRHRLNDVLAKPVRS